MPTLAELRTRMPQIRGFDDEDAVAFIQQAYYPSRSLEEVGSALGYRAPPPPPPPRSGFAVANDTVIEAANAIAGSAGSLANFVSPGNAFSQGVDRFIRLGEENQSDAVKAEKQRFNDEVGAAEGIGGELAAVGGYVARNPLLSAAQAAGSFAVPGAAIKGAQGLGRVAGLSRGAAGLAGGAAAGAALSGGDAAGNAYELAIQAGASEEEAIAAAREASVLPAVVGGVGGAFGAERAFAGAGGFAGNAAARALKTGLSEGAQEAFEEGVTNYEARRAAQQFDPSIDPAKGTAAAAGMGFALGAATGAGVGALSPQAQRDAVAMETLATTNDVGSMIAAANEIAGSPLVVPPFSEAQENRALTGMEAQMARDQQDIRFGGPRDTMRPTVAPVNAPAAAAPAEASAEFVETAPILDRLDNLNEQLATPEVRETIRAKLGDEAMNTVLYYVQQANRPSGVDGIPDTTRERIVDLAETIISRAQLQPIQAPRAVGSPMAPPALTGTQAPLAPRIGLDTTPTGVLRADSAGNVAPETRADAINTTQAVKAGQQAQATAAAEVATMDPQARRASAVFGEGLPRRPAAPTPQPQRQRTEAVDLTLPGAQQVDPVAEFVDRMRQVATPQARAFVQDFNAGRITRRDVIRVMQSQGQDPLTADQRIEEAAAQAPVPTQGIQAAPVYRSRTKAFIEARKVGGTVETVAGGFTVEMPDARPDAAGAGGRGAVDVGAGDGAVVLAERAGRPGAAGDAVPGADAGVAVGDDGRGRDGALNTVDVAAQQAATSPTNDLAEPTQAQKKTGKPLANVSEQAQAGSTPAEGAGGSQPVPASTKSPDMPVVADIPRDAAYQAHLGTSHVPDERAVQEQEGFRKTLRSVWDRAIQQAGNDQAAIDRITEVYKDVAEGYRSRYLAALGARSRVMSSMIAGPARFPVERNRKRMETERKRSEEARQYLERGIKRLERAARGPVDNSPEAELESLRQRLTEREELQDKMKSANAAIRKGDDAALEDLGFSEAEIAAMKKGDYAGRKGFADYQLTNNNAEIRRLRERLAEAERRVEAAAAGPVESERPGVRIVEDAQDDRLRMFFDDKPTEEVREALKRAAFKWAPSAGAWQRQLTDNARRAAADVLDKFFPPGDAVKASRRVGDQTDTEAFKRWFGESKVVDAEGKPLVVYHGTGSDFSVFQNAVERGGDPDFAQAGLYFAENAALADTYGDRDGGSVMPVYLNIRNPIDLTNTSVIEGWKGVIAKAIAPRMAAKIQREQMLRDGLVQSLITQSERDRLIAAGYDGIKGQGGVWIAFRPEQIKSAIGNRGRFDPSNADIRASRPADAARAAQRWTRTDRNTAGPEFYGRDVDLIALREFDLADEFSDDALPLGHTASVRDGNTAHQFMIVDHDGGLLGMASLEVNQAGQIEAIHDIEMTEKRTGAGRQVVEAILANADGQVRIIDILDQSDAFWQKMGAGYKDTYGNATADWASYRAQGQDPRASQSRGARAGEELEAGRQAAGEPEGGQGSRGQDVGPRADRGNIADLLRGSSGVGLPVRLANLYAAAYGNAGLQRVNVARNLNELPSDLRAKLSGFGDDVRGAYFPTEDEIWVFSDKLNTPEELHFVVIHEAFHRGLGAMFGNEARNLLRQMYHTNKKLRDRADLVARELQISRDEAIEEALADMAGEGQATKVRGWGKLIAMIRNWLRGLSQRLGVPMKFTDAQIETFVAGVARRGMERAEARADVVPGAAAAVASRAAAASPMAGINQQAIRDRLADQFKSAGEQVGWWDKTVGTQYDKAKRSPAFKKVFDHVQGYIQDTSTLANEAADRAPDILPKLESVRDVFNAAKRGLNAEDRKAIAAPVFEGTLNYGRQGGRLVPFEQLEAEAEAMTTREKEAKLLRDRFVTERELKAWKATPLDIYEGAIRNRYAQSYLQPGVVFSRDELRQLFKLNERQIAQYEQFRAAVDESLDQVVTADALRLLGDVPDELRQVAMNNRTGFRAAIEAYLNDRAKNETDEAKRDQLAATWNDIADKFNRVDDLKARGYAPLMRFGKYFVSIKGKDGEQQFFGLYETKAEANAMARELSADPELGKVEQGVMSQEAYKLFSGVPVESLEMFADALGAEKSEVFQEYLRLTKNNRSALKRLIKRKGTAGFSDEVSRVLASFVTSNARMAAGAMNLGQAKAAAEEIRAGDVKDEGVKLIEAVQNPTDTAGVVRGLMFTHFIGGSIASAVVNTTQPFMMTLPYLSQYGGAAKAAARLMASARMAVGGKIADKEMAAALERAERDGIVSPQEIHHLTAEAMATWGKNPVLKRAAFLWGAPFSLAEQFNRRVTFLAAFQTAKAEGIADPFRFAHDAVVETQGLYNKGNASNWARNPLGATALTFKQYSVHYLEWIRRMWNAGEPGSKERTDGRRAVLMAMALLMLAGGTEGLPFADDLNDLADTALQSLGYDTSAKGWKREFIARTLGLGDTGADVAMRGLSAVPGIPLDVSMRMGMGNLLPGTGMLLKSNTDVSRDVLELAGPAGALVNQYKDAGRKALDGDIGGAALGMLPTAMQNVGKAATMWTTGEARDTRGRRVMEADEIDGLMKLIGFQPADIARQSSKMNEQDRRIKLVRAVETSIADQWAQGVRERDAEMVAEAREQLREWNETNPDSRIAINSAQIKRRVRDLSSDKSTRFERSAPKELRGSVAEALQ